jgi:hypothetical protein
MAEPFLLLCSHLLPGGALDAPTTRKAELGDEMKVRAMKIGPTRLSASKEMKI